MLYFISFITFETHLTCYFDRRNYTNLAKITSTHDFVPLVLRVVMFKLIFHQLFTSIYSKTIILSNFCFVLLLFSINSNKTLDL